METKSTKRIGWDDDSIKGGGYAERPDTFKVKQGFTDTIRILTFPLSLIEVNVKGRGGKGFSTPSLADHDDVLEGFLEGNDKDAKARAMEQCPALARGHKVQRRFVCLIWHASRSKGGKTKKINQVVPFKFSGDKYEMLKTISESLPPLKNGKRRPLYSVELHVTCSDTQFQKMNISYSPTQSQKWSEVKELVADSFDAGEFSVTGESDLLTAVCEQDTFQSLQESLDRIEGKGQFADTGNDDSDDWEDDDIDDEDDAPKPARSKKKPTKKRAATKTGTRKKKPAPVDDDDELADELDDALSDDELDDYDDEDEEFDD